MDYKKLQQQNRNRQMNARLQSRGMGASPSGADSGAQGLTQKFDTGILAGFKPGNIGDINNVIWPFWFVFSSQDLAPNQSVEEAFTVTQEAGFLLRQISQQTYLKDPVTGAYEYIDPFYFDESANAPVGLSYVMSDAQSSRQYNGRTPDSVANLGCANFPKMYPSTVFMLPNQTMVMNLSNSGLTSNTYRCFITVMGYRVRVQDAQQILSLVSG